VDALGTIIRANGADCQRPDKIHVAKNALGMVYIVYCEKGRRYKAQMIGNSRDVIVIPTLDDDPLATQG
jgi:hypothetical protein